MESLLNEGVEAAGKDPEMLLKVTRAAENVSTDIAVTAAQRAVEARPSPEAYLLLVDALSVKYIFLQGEERQSLMKRAETAARSANKLTRVPTVEMRVKLGGILKDEGQYAESESLLRAALLSAQGDNNTDLRFQAIRSLIECAAAQNKPEEERSWFAELAKNDKANAFDWDSHGDMLYAAKDFKGAGDAYSRAAALITRDWCNAGTAYEMASETDSALYAERQCIEKLQGTT
ncbi:MAG: hypothetical protein LAP86_32345 [Acidobacteriia bacterium]|nr:hypothetical protein [Terriglobia bacterium]